MKIRINSNPLIGEWIWSFLEQSPRKVKEWFFLPAKGILRRKLLDKFLNSLEWKNIYDFYDGKKETEVSSIQFEVLKMIVKLKRPWFYLNSSYCNKLIKMDWNEIHGELSPRWIVQELEQIQKEKDDEE